MCEGQCAGYLVMSPPWSSLAILGIGLVLALPSPGRGQLVQEEEIPQYDVTDTEEPSVDDEGMVDYSYYFVPNQKRFDSFFNQRAREKYLIGKSPAAQDRSLEEPVKVKR